MYTKLWAKIISLMKKKFDSEPVYGDNEKYIKTKIKSYGDKVNTNIHNKEKKCIIQMYVIDNDRFFY